MTPSAEMENAIEINGLEDASALSQRQWVAFKLLDEVYALDVLHIREILKITDITAVPGAPDYILGVINLRGNIVTVLDTRKRFGLGQNEPGSRNRIIFIDMHEQVIGLMVDAVLEVVTIADKHINTHNGSNHMHKKYIHGTYSDNGQVIILLETEKIIDIGLAVH